MAEEACLVAAMPRVCSGEGVAPGWRAPSCVRLLMPLVSESVSLGVGISAAPAPAPVEAMSATECDGEAMAG